MEKKSYHDRVISLIIDGLETSQNSRFKLALLVLIVLSTLLASFIIHRLGN